MKKLALVLLFVAALAPPAMAGTVTVVNQGTVLGVNLVITSPSLGTVTASVGAEGLLVDNVAFKGFCIDLYHYSSGSPLLYTVDSLALSPESIPPGNMGVARADFIKEMWAYGYANAMTSASQAAGFQLAIWGVLQGSVSGGTATANWTWLSGGLTTAQTYGADALIGWANSNAGSLAYDVVGLNRVDPPGGAQSYAVQGVPDGGTTAMLLGLALAGLATVRKFRG